MQIHQSLILPKSDRFFANQVALLTTSPIIAAASEASGIDSEAISPALEVEVIEGTDLFTISAHHDDKGRAQKMIQAVFDSYRDHRREIELDYTKKETTPLKVVLQTKSKLIAKQVAKMKSMVEDRKSDGADHSERQKE